MCTVINDLPRIRVGAWSNKTSSKVEPYLLGVRNITTTFTGVALRGLVDNTNSTDYIYLLSCLEDSFITGSFVLIFIYTVYNAVNLVPLGSIVGIMSWTAFKLIDLESILQAIATLLPLNESMNIPFFILETIWQQELWIDYQDSDWNAFVVTRVIIDFTITWSGDATVHG